MTADACLHFIVHVLGLLLLRSMPLRVSAPIEPLPSSWLDKLDYLDDARCLQASVGL